MAPRRLEEIPVKRIAAFGCRLSSRLPRGEILTDITENKWRIGDPIGCGGFGDIYLASDDITKPVEHNSKYVVKIEPHNNGPLFVEMNFYIRAARKPMIQSWCKSYGRRRIGVPTYEGSGSHIYQNQRYRFLVIPRYGIDVGKLFVSYGRKLSTKLVNGLAVQMLDALEYIHSQGYAHADVKGSNILLTTNGLGSEVEKAQAFLVDYGLAYRFRSGNGVHKPFVHDERRAHEGTLEFTSRDAHHGTHSRRGDLETLGYNLLQWLCGKLPWEKENELHLSTVNPEEIQAQKEKMLSDVSLSIQKCFSGKRKAPENLIEYFTYISRLGFETKPNYTYLRNLFCQGSMFEENILTLVNKGITNENFSRCKFDSLPYLRERKPCRPVNGEIRITRNTQPIVPKKVIEFSWEEVLSRHPDKLAKISVFPPPFSLTPPPSPPPITPTSSLPTYAMLNVLQRMKEKQSGIIRHKTSSKSSDNELKPKWMTPAMEEIAQLIKRNLELASQAKVSNLNNSRRLTRSESAKLRRLENKSTEKINSRKRKASS
ncbi:serine/threonine-protein kinase VRK1-like [Leptopilina boulardi]|uniref:serine/threonine-protein kinase VRK1-like n=1 Tax=Leptopilina boulardi TaxID=63433 RepID=UPI0021F67BDF|nr:serine/threonine-protein kinase VRK1-like [Leptopilina boulardi]